ncbi:hypothetical protein KPZU09_69520 [Klebsiella pneumoniae]|uniref:Uncharacterized protein n=1 Tax=Klebsiella pneumoniae TaxID=573 RepID=A0A919HYW7_KLEPN|nr:hypothetical protein KPZU09_69520 [Klebsiella pneumoniae]
MASLASSRQSASDSHRPLPGEVRASGEPWRESSRPAAAPDKQREEQFGQQQVEKRHDPARQPAEQHPGKGRRQLNAGEPAAPATARALPRRVSDSAHK